MGDNKYYLKGRRTTKLVFDEGNNLTTRMYFDETTGLPIKVEHENINGTAIYNYDDLTAGTVREEDVVHRDAADIPSSEAFYSTYS